MNKIKTSYQSSKTKIKSLTTKITSNTNDDNSIEDTTSQTSGSKLDLTAQDSKVSTKSLLLKKSQKSQTSSEEPVYQKPCIFEQDICNVYQYWKNQLPNLVHQEISALDQKEKVIFFSKNLIETIDNSIEFIKNKSYKQIWNIDDQFGLLNDADNFSSLGRSFFDKDNEKIRGLE